MQRPAARGGEIFLSVWKYRHYVGYAPELFDLEADPSERNDVVASRGEVVAQYERLLRGICDPQVIDRRAKADQAALVERFGGRETALATGTPGATPAPE